MCSVESRTLVTAGSPTLTTVSGIQQEVSKYSLGGYIIVSKSDLLC